MRTTFKLAAVSMALAAAVASSGAQAQSVDVKVTGQIVPAACSFDISGGGVFNYGNIPASSLNPNSYTYLEPQRATYTIACDAPVKVGLRAVDNRADSRIQGIVLGGDHINFGLGMVAGVPVGGYNIGLGETATADGSTLTSIASTDGATWQALSLGAMPHGGPISSWGAESTGPAAVRTLTGTMSVLVGLDHGNRLPLSGPVPLDGLATIELVYL